MKYVFCIFNGSGFNFCNNTNSLKPNNSLDFYQNDNYDPLPSWKEGKTKQDIIEFVTSVTNTDSKLFIPVQERIAAFDNDGTHFLVRETILFSVIFCND